MLSKNKLKYIKSLQLKKYRKEEQSFVVEGAKSVSELLESDFVITFLAGTSEFLDTHSRILPLGPVEVVTADEEELSAAGSLQTNYTALAIARMKPNVAPVVGSGEFVMVLDDLRDPGNLGTIIRTSDWY
jgi:TrmH family RNA methyltransferase